MIIMLTAFLAGATVLPQIDRTALDLQSRAEALQPRSRAQTRSVRPRPVASAPAQPHKVATAPVRRPVTTAAAPVRRAAPRRASGGSPLDLAQITTICRAAGNQEDPAGFLARLSNAYSLNANDSVSLRASCAAYLAGRADARRTGGGTY